MRVLALLLCWQSGWSAAPWPERDIEVQAQDGSRRRFFRDVIGSDAAAVQFIFTSCKLVCPASTASFARLQKRLAAEGTPGRLVSVTVDPEKDTPAVLRAYAARFGADHRTWTFVTAPPAVLERLLELLSAGGGRPDAHSRGVAVFHAGPAGGPRQWTWTAEANSPALLQRLLQEAAAR